MIYMDWTYLVFVLPAFLIALFAQINMNRVFNKYGNIRNSVNYTGYDAARRILDANGLQSVGIERVMGNYSDHYDPRKNIIRLSDSVYGGNTIASIGIAAHEAGHAVQYAHSYVPMKIRASLCSVTNIGSAAAFPLIIIGIIFSYPTIAYAGVILFSFTVLFQLVTLPVEFNASKRAVKELEGNYYFNKNDINGAKKVLRAAALTYVAGLAAAVLQMLRLIIIAGRANRRR